MKVKVIGVNPINPKDSGLIKEGELTEETAIRLLFKHPIGLMQIRLVHGELVIYIGHPIDVNKYKEALAAAKKRKGEEK